MVSISHSVTVAFGFTATPSSGVLRIILAIFYFIMFVFLFYFIMFEGYIGHAQTSIANLIRIDYFHTRTQ